MERLQWTKRLIIAGLAVLLLGSLTFFTGYAVASGRSALAAKRGSRSVTQAQNTSKANGLLGAFMAGCSMNGGAQGQPGSASGLKAPTPRPAPAQPQPEGAPPAQPLPEPQQEAPSLPFGCH